MDFKNFKNDLASIHTDTLSIHEKIQNKIDKPDEDDHLDKMLEDKNKEYIKHTVLEIVNNFMKDKFRDGSLNMSTTVGDTTVIGKDGTTGTAGKDGKDGVSGSGNYKADLQNLNKKIMLLEDQMKSLSDKVENYEPEEIGGGENVNKGGTGEQTLTDKAKSSDGFKDAEQLNKILKRLKTCESSISDLKTLKPDVFELKENDKDKEGRLNNLSDMTINSILIF